MKAPMALALMLACGCSHHSAAPAHGQKATRPREHRTVEFVEKSGTEIREKMAEWQREGWNVLSVSKALPKPDGTVVRRAELER